MNANNHILNIIVRSAGESTLASMWTLFWKQTESDVPEIWLLYRVQVVLVLLGYFNVNNC